jgi:hypothetical protein
VDQVVFLWVVARSLVPLRNQSHSADDAREERQFLRQLRGKTALLDISLYAGWMSKRFYIKLIVKTAAEKRVHF